jgi:hypothetical protein
VQDFDGISYAVENLVGATSNKNHPDIGIVGPIAAVWMLSELRHRLADACRYVARAADGSLSQYWSIRSRSANAAGV